MSDPPDLPPVAAHSSLLAVAPASPPPSDFGSSAFDTSELEHALHRSQQIASSSGLRRAVSAPHSLDSLAHVESAGRSGYLQPSGGPMRRVASSLGMRRSSSFFWSPTAHYDFERAVATLRAQGKDENIPAALILPLMRHHPEIRLQDIEKHMTRKRIVTNRLIMQLQSAPDGQASPSSRRSAAMPPVVEEPCLLNAAVVPFHVNGLGEQMQHQKQQLDQLDQQIRHMLPC